MSNLPLVSIILPIRNEAAHIETTLQAIFAQEYPPERLEILVADGRSTDRTREIVQSVPTRGQELAIIDNPGKIVPTGFNAALRRARGEIIVRVDGHCLIAPDYVRRCVESLKESGADNVGGLQRKAGKTLVGRAIALATSSPFGVGHGKFHYADKPGWADTVYLGAYRREVFERLGGFDEELVRNQDDEFNFRLRQSGGRIWLDPSIRVLYYPRSSFKALCRQYFQYGLYKVRVIQKRGGIPSWRHLIPPAFVACLGLSWLLALMTRRTFWALIVAGPYLAANLAASVRMARQDWQTLPLLPLAFLTIHLAYGAGFLWGFWHWRRCWGPPA